MQIADALLLPEEILREHLKEFRSSRKLKPENGRSKEKLSSKQSKQLIDHLEKHTYLYVKDIALFVKSAWGILYSISGVTDRLHRNRFSYKKPSPVLGKANPKAQEARIFSYKQLRQNPGEDETGCFADGTHPTHNTQLSYGWIRKGVRKEICSNTGRQRINLFEALDVIEKRVHFREDPMLTAEATTGFLQKPGQAYPSKKRIRLFLDNAGCYKNHKPKAYLETSKIEAHYLPPYSPNLNPIERLRNRMKQRVLYNTHYECFDDFKQAIFGFLKSLSKLDPRSESGQALLLE